MSNVVYVRQGRNRPTVRSRGARARPRSLSRSPTRLILAPANRSQTLDDIGAGRTLPGRLKLQVRGPANGIRAGPNRRSDGSEAGVADGDPDHFSETFFRLVFLGATRLKHSEPGILELNALVEEIRCRSMVYKERGVAIPCYTMNINTKNIALLETQTRDLQQIPINRIHFVAADPRCPNVFSLVARGRGNRFFCHVFECSNHWQCDSITKTVSLAFRLAYEKWMRVEENQRRVEERRAREMDMGGLEYFQEWDDHAPRGMPLYNISSYYNSGSSRPRQYLRPHDEMPRLPDRLIVSRGNNREPESEPYSVRFTFDEDDYDDSPQEEVYVRQEAGGRRGRQQPVVYDIRPDWE
ncbi:uncharacterized protein LOC110980984 isoform X1 [Acanthaster planci]|uniref:Uncharacterized protein LOC110980984 isoform X1 n=1 Tax=Acanthaster planci TaxID=133434 RepID=A0A8B7YKK0_ACAPL|nr:uncharacterized protein LOC110980984 isoform X1 [Acanthaster planci]